MDTQHPIHGQRFRRTIGLVVALLAASPVSLFATWSIVAVDTETRQVGSAGASYSPAVWPILGIVGGKGVIVAQASSNLAAKRLGMQMMQDDVLPQDILDQLTDPTFDESVDVRQYGVATLYGGTAAYTGKECWNWAGTVGTDSVMLQGNILVSKAVLDDALAAYTNAQEEGLPLGDRLVAAMGAASAAGGDSRGGQATAMTAYLAIASPDDRPGTASYAIVVTPQRKDVNPVRVLTDRYETTKGRSLSMRFLTMPEAILLLLVFPVLIGWFLTAVVARGKRDRSQWKALGTAALVGIVADLVSVLVLREIASGVRMAVPAYGSVLLVILALNAIALFAGIGAVVVVKAIVIRASR